MTQTLSDIASRTDIERLVDGFYERVRGDAVLGPVFDDVAHTDWARHLPRMYDFWEGVLFGVTGFQGDPLAVHLALARRVPLGDREFGRWLDVFQETVGTLFHGPCADDVKARASRIAAVMQHHLSRNAAPLRPSDVSPNVSKEAAL